MTSLHRRRQLNAIAGSYWLRHVPDYGRRRRVQGHRPLGAEPAVHHCLVRVRWRLGIRIGLGLASSAGVDVRDGSLQEREGRSLGEPMSGDISPVHSAGRAPGDIGAPKCVTI